MKLTVYSNAFLFLIIRFNLFFSVVVAPNLDPFTPHYTRSYSLWNSLGILDGVSTQNPESGTFVGLNGNLCPAYHHFSFFQHQPEFSHKEIPIQDSGETLTGKNVLPQVNERFTFNFPRLSSLDTVAGAGNSNFEKRKYSQVLGTECEYSDVNTSTHKNKFIPISHVPSIVDTVNNGKDKEVTNDKLIQIHDATRPSELEDTVVSHSEDQSHHSQERSLSEHENEWHDAPKNLKTPSQALEMNETMEGMKKSLETTDKSKLKGVGEDKTNSGSNKWVKQSTLQLQGIAKEMPQPKGSDYNAIVSRESNRKNKGHSTDHVSGFENKNLYKVLDEYFSTDEADRRSPETDDEIKVNELENDKSSRVSSLTKTKSKEEEELEPKGIAETDVYEESSSLKVPGLASHLARKGPKRGKGKTKKKSKKSEAVYMEQDVQTFPFLKATTTSPKRRDPELQESISSNTKETFLKLSKFEFLCRCLKLKNKTEGLKINLTDLEFEYMMVNGYATDPKSWTDHIKMYTSEFGSLMEGKRRLMSILEQFKERYIVLSWNKRRDTLSPSVQRIGILLKADQSFPKFENCHEPCTL